MKIDIEGGEFAVFGGREDLGWLDQVDQVVMEVHPEWGDAAALVDRLRRRGFTASLRDNEGTRVSATSRRLEYAISQPVMSCRMALPPADLLAGSGSDRDLLRRGVTPDGSAGGSAGFRRDAVVCGRFSCG